MHFSKKRWYTIPTDAEGMRKMVLNTKHKHTTKCGIVIEGRRRTNCSESVTCKACIAVLTAERLNG